MEPILQVGIGSIVSILSLIVVVIRLYLNQRKTKKDVELTKRGLAILSELVDSLRGFQESGLQLEREKLELKKREQEWSKFKDIAKAAGWIWEYL